MEDAHASRSATPGRRSCRASYATCSHELGKPIELEMHGADTELDRQVLDPDQGSAHPTWCATPRTTGLESPAERRAAGKPEKGTVRLSAWHEGGHIIIEIADDGRGLHTDRIKAAVLARGLAAESRARQDVGKRRSTSSIFSAGFSDRHHGHQRVGPRRRHGRGAQQYRPDRRHHRRQVGVRPGARASPSRFPLTLAIVAALDRGGAPAIATRSRSSPWSSWCGVRSNSEAPRRAHQGCRGAGGCANKLLPLVRLKTLLGNGRKTTPE